MLPFPSPHDCPKPIFFCCFARPSTPPAFLLAHATLAHVTYKLCSLLPFPAQKTYQTCLSRFPHVLACPFPSCWTIPLAVSFFAFPRPRQALKTHAQSHALQLTMPYPRDVQLQVSKLLHAPFQGRREDTPMSVKGVPLHGNVTLFKEVHCFMQTVGNFGN